MIKGGIILNGMDSSIASGLLNNATNGQIGMGNSRSKKVQLFSDKYVKSKDVLGTGGLRPKSVE
jgi:hypothetical protein